MKTLHVQLDSQRPDNKVTLRLLGFVLVSIALHSVVLLSQHSSSAFIEQHNTTMQITLGDINTVEVPVEPKRVEKKQLKPTPRTAISMAPINLIVPSPKGMEQTPVTPTPNEPVAVIHKDTTAITPPEKTTTDTNTAVTTTTAQTQSIEQQRITLKQRLKQALAKHFYYPMLARKRGWQGQVLLAFSLDTRGTIINAHITQDSGYGALDRAALKSLNKVVSINAEPSRELSFQIPIIYSLNGV
ncbi:MAG: TonB family protein [Pseudomonadota bacterium]